MLIVAVLCDESQYDLLGESGLVDGPARGGSAYRRCCSRSQRVDHRCWLSTRLHVQRLSYAGLPQSRIGELLGVSQPTVSKILGRGLPAVPGEVRRCVRVLDL